MWDSVTNTKTDSLLQSSMFTFRFHSALHLIVFQPDLKIQKLSGRGRDDDQDGPGTCRLGILPVVRMPTCRTSYVINLQNIGASWGSSNACIGQVAEAERNVFATLMLPSQYIKNRWKLSLHFYWTSYLDIREFPSPPIYEREVTKQQNAYGSAAYNPSYFFLR